MTPFLGAGFFTTIGEFVLTLASRGDEIVPLAGIVKFYRLSFFVFF